MKLRIRFAAISTMLLSTSFAALRFGGSLFTASLVAVSLVAASLFAFTTASAQGPRPSDLGASRLDIGQPGIAWYTTWSSASDEAERSGRPMMFVAAATQCNGISGVF